jgi:hypothetical protein
LFEFDLATCSLHPLSILPHVARDVGVRVHAVDHCVDVILSTDAVVLQRRDVL